MITHLQEREQALEPFGWTALVGAGERWNQGDLADSALVSGTGRASLSIRERVNHLE